MSVKQQLAATIDTLPESVTLEDAIERIYRAFKAKRARLGMQASDLSTDAPTPEQRFLERANQQYALARKYPGESVVLLDTEVLFHSPDLAAAMQVYKGALKRPDGRYPVLIGPDAQPPTVPIVRGRSTIKL